MNCQQKPALHVCSRAGNMTPGERLNQMFWASAQSVSHCAAQLRTRALPEEHPPHNTSLDLPLGQGHVAALLSRWIMVWISDVTPLLSTLLL